MVTYGVMNTHTVLALGLWHPAPEAVSLLPPASYLPSGTRPHPTQEAEWGKAISHGRVRLAHFTTSGWKLPRKLSESDLTRGPQRTAQLISLGSLSA